MNVAVLSMLFEILGTILPHLQTAPQKKLDSRILGAIEYIEKNYTEPIAVDTLASVANMSASRFYPAFKDALGATPVDYLNHYRVNRAMMFLATDLTKWLLAVFAVLVVVQSVTAIVSNHRK